MKMCEQILKTHPNTIQILWIVKNQEKANNSPSYRCAAIKNQEKAIQLKLHERMNKKWLWRHMVVTKIMTK